MLCPEIVSPVKEWFLYCKHYLRYTYWDSFPYSHPHYGLINNFHCRTSYLPILDSQGDMQYRKLISVFHIYFTNMLHAGYYGFSLMLMLNYFFSKVPAFLNVVDIAGLVKGASEGQGLGNAFLSHIKACDSLFHMCRELHLIVIITIFKKNIYHV